MTEPVNKLEITEIVIDIKDEVKKEKECNCCLTTENVIICPLEKCDYPICKKCLKKISGNLCPACRREIKKKKMKKVKFREEVYIFCGFRVSRNMAERLACLRGLFIGLSILLVCRVLWFLTFNDRPFFHDTWFLSTLGGLLQLIAIFLALTIFLCIVSTIVNCFYDCISCFCYDYYDEYPLISIGCIYDIIENGCCVWFERCIRREIHIVTSDREVEVNVESDYSDDESSLDLD
jgi:hypothetical protein